MGELVNLCRWIGKCLSLFLTVATGITGAFISMFFALTSFATSINSDFGGLTSSIVAFLNDTSSAVHSFIESVSSFEYYPLFHDLLAIDTLGSLFTAACAIIFSLLLFFAVGIFVHCVVLLVPFISFRIVTKAISLLSAGIMKP